MAKNLLGFICRKRWPIKHLLRPTLGPIPQMATGVDSTSQVIFNYAESDPFLKPFVPAQTIRGGVGNGSGPEATWSCCSDNGLDYTYPGFLVDWNSTVGLVLSPVSNPVGLGWLGPPKQASLDQHIAPLGSEVSISMASFQKPYRSSTLKSKKQGMGMSIAAPLTLRCSSRLASGVRIHSLKKAALRKAAKSLEDSQVRLIGLTFKHLV